jgi:hypothetical protein
VHHGGTELGFPVQLSPLPASLGRLLRLRWISAETCSYLSRGLTSTGSRALPAAAALTIVILPPSDWPLGWSVWVEHPLVPGRGATIGTLVDAILRRRRHVAGSTWFANRDPCRSSNRSEIVRTFRH